MSREVSPAPQDREDWPPPPRSSATNKEELRQLVRELLAAEMGSRQPTEPSNWQASKVSDFETYRLEVWH